MMILMLGLAGIVKIKMDLPKLIEEDIKELRHLLISWEDDNISDYEYCNKAGDILLLGKWTCKGMRD
jgi:hypothetical protein